MPSTEIYTNLSQTPKGLAAIVDAQITSLFNLKAGDSVILKLPDHEIVQHTSMSESDDNRANSIAKFTNLSSKKEMTEHLPIKDKIMRIIAQELEITKSTIVKESNRSVYNIKNSKIYLKFSKTHGSKRGFWGIKPHIFQELLNTNKSIFIGLIRGDEKLVYVIPAMYLFSEVLQYLEPAEKDGDWKLNSIDDKVIFSGGREFDISQFRNNYSSLAAEDKM